MLCEQRRLSSGSVADTRTQAQTRPHLGRVTAERDRAGLRRVQNIAYEDREGETEGGPTGQDRTNILVVQTGRGDPDNCGFHP